MKNIKAAWNSNVFGGNVFKPIRAAFTGIGGLRERRLDGKKVEKKNCLKKLIENAEIDALNGGGFYTLKDVKVTSNTYLDIEILI
jgi:hypothetical protein